MSEYLSSIEQIHQPLFSGESVLYPDLSTREEKEQASWMRGMFIRERKVY